MAATLIGFTRLASASETPEEFLPLPALWDATYTARTGAGFKDNVFLSHAREQSSAFVSLGGDVLVIRLPVEGPQFTLFAGADANHFVSTKPEHTEYTAFALARLEHDFTGQTQASLGFDYFFQDQFLDVVFLDASAGGTNLSVRATQVRGHSLSLRPGVRVELGRGFWSALETPLSRHYYDQPLSDYSVAGASISFGRLFGYGSEIKVTYAPAWEFYDSDPALNASGDSIAGTQRERFAHDALLTWGHYWDEAKHWRSTAKLGARVTEENGGGFGNYTRWSASAQISYRAKPWEVSVTGRGRGYYYHTQTVSTADPSKRRRGEWAVVLGIERELTARLKLIAHYEHERMLSNDDRETYTVNTVSGALQWEF